MQESKFLHIFRVELEDPSLGMSSQFKQHPKWTSLVSIIIINEIESEFGIILEVNDIKDSDSIGDLFNLLSNYSLDS